MTLDDETLMAFADGELPPDRAAAVEAALTTEPDAVARLQRIRAVRQRLAGALDAIAPPVDVMDRAKAAVAARRGPGGWPMMAVAGVAGLAVGALLTAPFMAGRSALAPDLTAGPALKAALNATPSGAVSRRGGRAIAVLYSVIGADGRPCRGFRIRRGETVLEGAACRSAETWQVLVLAPAGPEPAGFGQASGGEPAAVAAAVDALQPGPPLDAAAEARLIRRGWSE
ncbi:MAG: hypothetical protein JNK30_02105 [Phenylobacterium sp.]|uniref:anti-sigma factor family protein n=1 Tax=Phenylobacterium sp. TaxID=1871053 RepID=UPI001A488B3B|nr:hypothetical protein [Phenylobacterium sp.]MBL8770149.1 hypothetical protein [Phenylobacterium sp.]